MPRHTVIQTSKNSENGPNISSAKQVSALCKIFCKILHLYFYIIDLQYLSRICKSKFFNLSNSVEFDSFFMGCILFIISIVVALNAANKKLTVALQ